MAAWAARAVEHARSVAVELQMVPVRTAVHIAGGDFYALYQGAKTMPEIEANLLPAAHAMLDEMAWWGQATRAQARRRRGHCRRRGLGPVDAMKGSKLMTARPSRRTTRCVRRHAQAQRRGAGCHELPYGLPRQGAVCGVARACKARALLRAGALHPAPWRGNAIPFHGVNRP
jgi:hypothetical protein